MEDGQGTNENSTEAPVNEARVDSGLTDALGGLVSQETLDKLKSIDTKGVDPNSNQESGQEGQESGGEGSGQEGDEGEEEKEAIEKSSKKDEKKDDKQKSEKKNPFGLKNKQDKKSDIVIENTDQILEVVKSKFGQDIKDIKELPKFFETTSKWREDSQKLESVTTEKEKYESILSNLPDDIISSMEMYFNGKDYTKAFDGKPKFNFDVPVEKQDTKELVSHYFPNKFSEEDFAEETPSAALEIAISASTDKFKAEKQLKDAQRAKVAEDAQKSIDLYNASVNGSVNHLKQSFPEVDENEVKNIRKILEGGANAIVAHFCNPDGTLKETTAESLMFAIHGKSLIADYAEAESHVTETKINEELLSRGNETRKPKQGNGVNTISDSAKQVLADLGKFKEKTTY